MSTSTDTTYPRIRPAKLNAHWSATEPPFDRTSGEFAKWSTKLEIFLQQSGLDRYIFASEKNPERLIRQPDPKTEPNAYANWLSNNDLIIGVIRAAVSEAEQEGLETDGTAKECYDALKSRAQREGPVKQVALIRQALSTYAPIAEPIDATARKICDLIDRAFAIGAIDKDLLKCIALLNSINDKSFESLQTQVSRGLSDATTASPYTSSQIRKLFQTVDSLSTLSRTSQVDTALTVRDSKPSTHPHNHGPNFPCCEVCYALKLTCRGHTKEWCIRPGGGMAGKTIEESKAARLAARGGAKGGKSKQGGGSTGIKNGIAVKGLDGQAYIVDVDNLQKIQLETSTKTTEFAGAITTSSTDFFEYGGFMATDKEEPRATINWNTHSIPAMHDCETILATTAIIPTNPSSDVRLISLTEKPFYMDSGATVHISPCAADFVMLRSIAPRAVKGVGGTSIQAIGIGQIRLQVQNKTEIFLENALYIPTSAVRLISISALTAGMKALITFSRTGVTILDEDSGTLLAAGPLIPGRRLYTIELQDALSEHALTAAQRPVKIDTWHWRLGHANYQVVATMAQNGLLPGMPSASSLALPKCDVCILGKQTKTSVPKVREEGHRAVRRLQIVWIDLAGPMNVQSYSGNKYIMDLVDDYTNMPWSIPLKSKADAFAALQAWEKTRELETGEKVGVYRTGHDGELKNHQVESWLNSKGTKHEYGAPYTSQHMGRVERMHRTLQGKARTMRLAAKCPDALWDEFYLTAAHLHAKTITKSLGNKTPFELWYNRTPDYSYMREIGCRAFVLILHQHNPKLNARGVECILIGYASNSKSYRCYDPRTKKIYESYHVRFLERHDRSPTLTEGTNDRTQTSAPTVMGPDQRNTIEPMTIDEIHRMSSVIPFSTDDNDEPTHPTIIPLENHQDVPRDHDNGAATVPRRSNRTRIPTARASPDHPPTTRTEQAVLDSQAAGDRLRASRTEARNNRQRTATNDDAWPQPAHDGDQQIEHREHQLDVPMPGGALAIDNVLPDLANLASMEDIEHLLAVAESLGDPHTIDLGDEPRTWTEAKESADAKRWEEGYKEELRSLKDMGVYKLIPRDQVPPGHKVRKGRPVFKVKRDENGRAVRFKVRLVFKGFEQIYGRDYTRTTSPTARMESWRVLLHLAATQGWDAAQIDIKTAFLYGLLPEDETQYMEQPEGFEEPGKESWVWCLLRGLYGMKQAGRIWNQTLNDNMLSWGFTRLPCESCVYYRKSNTGTVIAAVHVDDFLCVASNKAENERFKKQLRSVWTISDLGLPKFVVGIAVEWDRETRTVKLSQSALIQKIITQFGQSDATPLSLPMEPGLKLRRADRSSLPPDEVSTLQKIPYRSLVGCLLYVAISTRPDISYAVQQLTQFVDSYTTVHWRAATRLVRYLKGTQNMKLVLGGTKGPVRLTGFTDSDWANCLDTRRSIGGYAWSLGSGVISWAARKQKSVAASSCEAEYMAAFESAQECIWLRALLKGIGYDVTDTPTPILCDNNAAINLSEDPTLHARVKHVDIKYHFLRERVQAGELCIRYVNTKLNVADIFTKALVAPLFIRLRTLLGLQTQ